MKKIKTKIIWVLIGVFVLSWITYAADYYSISSSNHVYVGMYEKLFTNSSSNKYFIPTKTSTEWNAFLWHKPTWVSEIAWVYTASSTCPPWGTMWLSLYEHDGAAYAVQWSVSWVYDNYINSAINFVWPYNFNWKTIYRWPYVGAKYQCMANDNIYKMLVVPSWY